MLKTCSTCKSEFPATNEYYFTRKSSKDGFRSQCKNCTSNSRIKYLNDSKEKIKKYNKTRYINNKEIIDKRNKEYNMKNRKEMLIYQKQHYKENKDTISEKHKVYQSIRKEWYAEIKKKYQEDNKDKITENNRKRNLKNKELISRQLKEYYKNNKEICFLKTQKRRSLKKNLVSTFTIEEWKIAKEYFNNCCAYCGIKAPLAKEHFIALYNNGNFTSDNILPSCKPCNNNKAIKDFHKWYPKFKHYSKEREEKILKYLNEMNA